MFSCSVNTVDVMTLSERGAPPRDYLPAAVLIAAAMVLGGGGSAWPLPEMGLQCLSAVVIAAVAVDPRRKAARAPWQAWLISALVLAVPAVQLVPLPSALWQALPGRGLTAETLGLVGAENAWRPWSLTPFRTLAALLAMVPAAWLLVDTARLSRSQRAKIVGTIAVVAFASLVIGAGQLPGGEGNPFLLYSDGETHVLTGFQANRNSTADVLLIGMIAAAASIREWNDGRRAPFPASTILVATALVSLLFAVGVLLTGSRTGIVLLSVALLAVALITWPGIAIGRKAAAAFAGGLVLVIGAGAAMLANSRMINAILSRFRFDAEFRPELWRDTLYAIGQYFPFGSGLGSFRPVFVAIERLEVVDETAPNRAHNDYLELALETGAFGCAVLAIIAVVLLVAIIAGARRPPAGSRSIFIFATATLWVIALHSLVDYPLRSMALACIVAASAALLLPVPQRRSEELGVS